MPNVKFDPVEMGRFTYKVRVEGSSKDEDVPREEPILYKVGDILAFETSAGPFSVQIESVAGEDVVLQSPLQDEKTVLTSIPVPGRGAGATKWSAGARVTDTLSEAERKLLRESQRFVANYTYRITVETDKGSLTDVKEGTWDC
jgi:hypothetical protein